MTHIPARTHTRGESFYRLPDTWRHNFMFGVFWHGITHGRTRLLHKPAHWGTLEAWSYLTSAMFFRLVMTGQLLEAKWGEGREAKQISTFLPLDCFVKISYWVEDLWRNRKIASSASSPAKCAKTCDISIKPVRQFLVMRWWQTLWFIHSRTAP